MDVSTRALLKAKNGFHNLMVETDEPEYMDDKVFVATLMDKGGVPVNLYATENEIWGELSRRPHIPSKKEAGVIRSLKAKTRQSEEWLRKHPKYGQMIAEAEYPNRKEISPEEYTRLRRITSKNYMLNYKTKTTK